MSQEGANWQYRNSPGSYSCGVWWGGVLSDSNFSGTWVLNLRIPNIFQDEPIKKLQVPLQGEM